LQGEPGQPENLKFSRGSTEMTFRQLKNLKFFREPTEMTLVLTEKPEIFSRANWNDLRVNWKNWNFLVGQLKWPPGQLKNWKEFLAATKTKN
jgi:hypothetical protein